MVDYKLKGIRVARGIKQCDMAKDIGVTPQYLNLIEKNKVEPRRDTMMKIARYLNMSVTELFFDE